MGTRETYGAGLVSELMESETCLLLVSLLALMLRLPAHDPYIIFTSEFVLHMVSIQTAPKASSD